MSDVVFKLRCLIYALRDVFNGWKENVWDVQLDELYCCNGRECGCNAATNRDYVKWGYQIDLDPPKEIIFHKDF